MNGREEPLEGPGMQQWHKGQRPETAATRQEGIQQGLQGDPTVGDRETSSRVFQRVAEIEGLDIAEGSAPFETEKATAQEARAGNVGAPATPGSFAPPPRLKKKTWRDCHLIKEPPGTRSLKVGAAGAVE
jgi:hypothetical protein